MKRFLDVVLATALLGGVFGVFTWTEPLGAGFDRVTTTVMSAAGGALLGAIIGGVAHLVGKVTGS